MPNRTSGAQLPTAQELFAILEHESPRRSVKRDFLQKNSNLYDAFRTLCDQAGAPYNWLTTYQELPLEELLPAIDTTLDLLKAYIAAHQDTSDLYAALFNALTLPDDRSESDAIFVFGAGTNARIERAVELYFEGISDTIIISGNRPFYGETKISEAERMAEFARTHGVPSSALLLEDKSITLPDNVKRTLDLLEQRQWQPASLTYVVTNYAMRRAYMEWYKFTQWDITIRAVTPHTISSSYTPEHWQQDEHVTSLVLNEYVKLVFETKMDLVRDSP